MIKEAFREKSMSHKLYMSKITETKKCETGDKQNQEHVRHFLLHQGECSQKKKKHHDNAPYHTSFFTGEFLTKNNMTVSAHPPCFSLFP
jgi:hypothetical protein